MKFNLIEEIEITDYEKQIGRELVVTEHPGYNERRYVVRFESTTAYEANYGSGDTIDLAIQNYCERLSGAILKDTNSTTEYKVPRLVHTKLLGR